MQDDAIVEINLEMLAMAFNALYCGSWPRRWAD
jgi:hypothetical protein